MADSPLESPTARWWLLPFAVVAVLALATAPLGVHIAVSQFAASAGLLAVAMGSVFLPWGRLPRGAQLLPLLAYLASTALLMLSQHSASTGLQPLVLIPIIVAALLYRPWESAFVVAATSLTSALVTLAETSSDVVTVRRAVLLGCVAGVLCLAAQLLRRRLVHELGVSRELLRQADMLGAAARELHAQRSITTIMDSAARLAAELTSPAGAGGRRASYLGIDGTRMEVRAQFDETGRRAEGVFDLADHPHIVRVVATGEATTGELEPGAVGPSVTAMIGPMGITHGAWAPVFVDGRLHGVLGTAGRGRPVDRGTLRRLRALGDIVGLAMANALALEDLALQATVDPLTGVANRRGLALHLAHLDRRPYAVVSVDLDALKGVNDALGHVAGDRAIATAARAMATVLRAGDLMSRTGGDEFVAVLSGAEMAEARTTADRMLRSLAGARWEGPPLRASMGIACGPAGADTDRMLQRADGAMYEAKRQGGMQVVEAAPDHLPRPAPA